MKSSKKFLLRIIPVFVVLSIILTSVTGVFAFGNFNNLDKVNGGASTDGKGSVGTVDNAVGKVWSTVVTVLQILAVAAIVIAGVRYMFASADTKADIKGQTVGLVVGAVLVFGASFIVQFIINVTSDVTGVQNSQTTQQQ